MPDTITPICSPSTTVNHGLPMILYKNFWKPVRCFSLFFFSFKTLTLPLSDKIVTTFYFNKDGPLAGATGDRKIRRRLPRIIEPNTPLRKYNSNLAYCHYLVQKFGFTGERFELLAVIENTCCVLLTNKYLRYLNVDPTHVLWSCAIETIRGTQLTRSAIVVLASARHSIPAGQVLDLQNLYDTLLKSIFLIKYNRCF